MTRVLHETRAPHDRAARRRQTVETHPGDLGGSLRLSRALRPSLTIRAESSVVAGAGRLPPMSRFQVGCCVAAAAVAGCGGSSSADHAASQPGTTTAITRAAYIARV